MIPRLERKYIPKLSKKKSYKKIKLIILMPFVLPLYGMTQAVKYLGKVLKIKRKNKPDIILKNIIAGWTNLVLHNPVKEETAMKRANICATCPAAKFSGGVHTVVVDKKTTQIRGLVCSDCGCPLSAKVRADYDYCPRGLW